MCTRSPGTRSNTVRLPVAVSNYRPYSAYSCKYSPSTLLKFHNLLRQREYRRLSSSVSIGKPGPKGPSRELIQPHRMKQRNPRFGCPRIAPPVSNAFESILTNLWYGTSSLQIRRITGFGIHAGGIVGIALCRMFNLAISARRTPRPASARIMAGCSCTPAGRQFATHTLHLVTDIYRVSAITPLPS